MSEMNEARRQEARAAAEWAEPTYLSRGRSWDKANEARVEAIEAMTPDQMRDLLMWLSGYDPEAFDKARFAAL